jgi:signal transduction histidine kinase
MSPGTGKVRGALAAIRAVGRRLLASRASLQWRVLFLVGVGLAFILGAFSVSSLLAVNESTDRALEERQALAETAAANVDYVLTQNLRALDEVGFADGVDLTDNNLEPEKEALRRTYFASIFGAGLYLTDEHGRVLWTEPERGSALGLDLSSDPHVAMALTSGKPVVSGLSTGVITGLPAASMLTPLRSPSGQTVGLVGGDIDLTGTALLDVIRSSAPGETGYAQVVDGEGTILASTRPEQLLQKSDHDSRLATLIAKGQSASGTCHDCHEQNGTRQRHTEVMAFSPLTWAPWGVVLRQEESEALAPAQHLKERAILLGVPSFLLALLVAWATVRSVTRPVTVLTSLAERIASGDLSQEVPDLGKDEVGQLARSFETMRVKLRDSLDSIQAWSRQLEERVQERTKELEASRDHLRQVAEENAALYEELKQKESLRGELLKKVIGAQEEERRRIARELHDETSQTLTALVMGMEAVTLAPSLSRQQLGEKLSRLKGLAVQTLDEVHNIIYDLRPSVLDDLGLVAGLEWYAENRLQPLGLSVHVEVGGQERRLPPEVETVLFRIGQEAISNVARHAEASNVFLTIHFHENAVSLEVEDDGKGFLPTTASSAAPPGWGLLGMRERATLLKGELDIASEPGRGTCVTVRVPLDERTALHEEHSRPHRR